MSEIYLQELECSAVQDAQVTVLAFSQPNMLLIWLQFQSLVSVKSSYLMGREDLITPGINDSSCFFGAAANVNWSEYFAIERYVEAA